MHSKLTLNPTVAYGDVDRREVMLLGRVFKMLQDAAIAHANQFGTGTDAVAERAETWVLSRIAVEIVRYPKAGESLRVETWSTGIKGFKGYRDFRVFDAQENCVLSGSSLWLYFSLKSMSLVRVPKPIIEGFPVGSEPAWCSELEKLPFDAPDAQAIPVPITLRYSDFDVNEHVNNAAYLDLVQTALAQAGRSAYPRRVQLKFGKAILLKTAMVEARVEPQGTTGRFSIEGEGDTFAVGLVEDAGDAKKALPPGL